MPITGIPKTSTASKTPSTASKTAATPSSNASSRAPWLKDAGKTTSTTQAPWSKRNATTTTPSPADKSNGTQKEVKLQSREIKVPVVTQRKVSVPVVDPPKPKPVKVTAPEDEYETSDSSEYEEVTDSGEEEEVTDDETDSSLEAEDKNKLPIEVKLKPVQKPVEVKKSPSAVGKFVKPALKKVPTLDKLNKAKPPPTTIPESKPLRHVEKPILPEEKKEENDFEFKRPQLRKSDSTTKKSKYMSCLPLFCYGIQLF